MLLDPGFIMFTESQVQLLKEMLFIYVPRSFCSVLSYVRPLCLIESKEESEFFSLLSFLRLQLRSLLQTDLSEKSLSRATED